MFVEKTTALVDSGKHALSSAPRVEEVVTVKPVAVVTPALQTDHISQEVYVTQTPQAIVTAAEPALAAAATATATPTKTGPITAIKNFFKGLFSSSSPRHSQKSSTTVTTTGTEGTATVTTSTTTTVAATNQPSGATSSS